MSRHHDDHADVSVVEFIAAGFCLFLLVAALLAITFVSAAAVVDSW